MEEKTAESMNLVLAHPTERLYLLISEEMDDKLREKAKEMNIKISVAVRLAIADFINK